MRTESRPINFSSRLSPAPEKQHRLIQFAHERVPSLNARLSRPIDRFQMELKSGEYFQRCNWGLTPSAQLNQHSAIPRPAVSADFLPDHTFLRIEWQAFAALDETINLFGIRIFQVSLATVKSYGEAAALLAENLETMPAHNLRYKRLTECHGAVARCLRGQ
jgi:hypothetical protein